MYVDLSGLPIKN